MNRWVVLSLGWLASTSVLAHESVNGVMSQWMHFLTQHGGASATLLCLVVGCVMSVKLRVRSR